MAVSSAVLIKPSGPGSQLVPAASRATARGLADHRRIIAGLLGASRPPGTQPRLAAPRAARAQLRISRAVRSRPILGWPT